MNSAKGNIFLFPAGAFMALIFVVPIFIVIGQSLEGPDGSWSLSAYISLSGGTLFWRVLRNTFYISISCTIISLIVGYVIAYHLSVQPPRRRAILLTLVLVPFWTSILVKSYAFIAILGQSGIINYSLDFVGLERVNLLFNRFGVIVGMVHLLVPFAVFPLLSNLLAQDGNLKKASSILGAGPVRTFMSVTLPLSLPGVLSGALICFVISLGFFITPALLGGRQDIMIGNLIDFHVRETLNWTQASALGVSLLIAVGFFIILIAVFGRNVRRTV